MFTDFTRVRDLFYQAASVPPEDREAWLVEACQGDPVLLAQLKEMLSAAGRDTQTQVSPAVQPDLLGNYRVLREIGRGGMGVVYLATRNDGTFRKNVALKVLSRDGINPELILRFRQERQVMAALDHPNIARILDAGDTREGMPWYVMEYVEGVPIDKYCDERRLSIAGRIEIFQQVCHAVEYLHQNSVLHRDLKPTNILVSSDGAVKLLDFGIARFVGAAAFAAEDLSSLGSRPMTPIYASPEQMSGATLKKTSDVYSLGVILYRLLAGRVPWESYEEKLGKLTAREDPPPPSGNIRERLQGKPENTAQVRRAMTGEIDSIVLMALRHDPSRRYQTAAELVGDLARYLEGRTVVAHHDSVAARSVKLLKRKRVAAAVIAGFLLLGGFGAWQVRRVAAIRQAGASYEANLRALLQGLETHLRSSVGEPTAKVVQDRIEDVRALKKAFSADFPAAVARSGGHAPELDALLERGIRYLDNVRKATPSDPQLILEIGGAYEELGLLEEKSPYANLANKQKALSTYEASAALMGNLVGARPEDPAIRERLEALNQRIKDLGGTPVLVLTSATPEQIKSLAQPPPGGQPASSAGSPGPQSPTPQSQKNPPIEDRLRLLPILPPDAPPPPAPVSPDPPTIPPTIETPARVDLGPPPAGAILPPPPDTPVVPRQIRAPPSTAPSGKLECDELIPQHGQHVFRNLPVNIKLGYDKKKWDAELQLMDGQSQRLILTNISSGPQKGCGKVTWTRNP
jgi:eukaryotic-like serine/threonine-protein kinase